jgi:hypothetical protein
MTLVSRLQAHQNHTTSFRHSPSNDESVSGVFTLIKKGFSYTAKASAAFCIVKIGSEFLYETGGCALAKLGKEPLIRAIEHIPLPGISYVADSLISNFQTGSCEGAKGYFSTIVLATAAIGAAYLTKYCLQTSWKGVNHCFTKITR